MICKIAIVGAGMAGLGAAQILIKHGITDILVIEAKEKPGGRIKTINVENSIIDLGAQWVHGIDTELYQIALENDLIHEERSNEGLGLYVRDDGYIFDNFLVNKVDFEVGKILTECENFVDTEIYPKSVGEFLEEKFTEFVKESEYDKDLLWELYDWQVRFQLIDNSCTDLKCLSAREWGRYFCLGKDGQAHINLKGGYQALVDKIAEKLPTEIFLFNTPIDDISFNNNDVRLLSSNGLIIKADFVIITSSIGVLKYSNILNFKLPGHISTCINAMGFGGMGKVFLLFEEKWWKTDGFQLVWRNNLSTFPLKNIGNWVRHLSGFDNVLDQPNMLVGWISGLGVEEMEKLPEATVGEHCVGLLRHFLQRDDIPMPLKVYKSGWSSCRWTRGGYSHTTPACDRLAVGPSILSEPVYIDGVPRVLFAGEATHVSHFSTTHGAYESGQQQAEALLPFCKNILQ